MASAAQALAKMREICLALPGTREGDHFGSAAFYVKGKLFATCGAKDGACEIIFGLLPEDAAALLKSDPRFRPYPRDRRGLVIDAADVTNWGEIRALVTASWELRKPVGAPRKPSRKPARAKRTRSG
jgi:hypothetical protein